MPVVVVVVMVAKTVAEVKARKASLVIARILGLHGGTEFLAFEMETARRERTMRWGGAWRMEVWSRLCRWKLRVEKRRPKTDGTVATSCWRCNS